MDLECEWFCTYGGIIFALLFDEEFPAVLLCNMLTPVFPNRQRFGYINVGTLCVKVTLQLAVMNRLTAGDAGGDVAGAFREAFWTGLILKHTALHDHGKWFLSEVASSGSGGHLNTSQTIWLYCKPPQHPDIYFRLHTTGFGGSRWFLLPGRGCVGEFLCDCEHQWIFISGDYWLHYRCLLSLDMNH